MRRCILHIGMPKTSSTSIQYILANFLEDPNFYYMNVGSPTCRPQNHGNDLSIAFRSNPLLTTGSRLKDLGKVSIFKQRKRIRKKINDQIERQKTKNIIFSAERLCSFNHSEILKIKNFLSAYINNFLIVGYIRTPKSYMESIFQEQLKSGRIQPQLESYYPCYRRKLKKFGDIFGWNNVLFWLFEPKKWANRCAVQDFCKRLNISIREENIVRNNEGLSKDAISLLYTYRLLESSGYGRRIMKEDRKLVQYLFNLKGSKLRFSSSLVKPILSKYYEDIEWMEEKLGLSLEEDLEKDDAIAINSKEDLLKIDPEVSYWLAEQLGPRYTKSWSNNMTPQDIAEWMHLLTQKI